MVYRVSRRKSWIVHLARSNGGMIYRGWYAGMDTARSMPAIQGWSAGGRATDALDEAAQHIDAIDGMPNFFAQTPKRIS